WASSPAGDRRTTARRRRLPQRRSDARAVAPRTHDARSRRPPGAPILPAPAAGRRCAVEPREVLAVDDIHLSDPLFWQRPLEEREGAFATLRRERPVSFHEEPEVVVLPRGPGYWAITRHADILHVSRHPELFCSGRGSNIGDMPQPFLEFFGSMINMDDPRH